MISHNISWYPHIAPHPQDPSRSPLQCDSHPPRFRVGPDSKPTISRGPNLHSDHSDTVRKIFSGWITWLGSKWVKVSEFGVRHFLRHSVPMGRRWTTRLRDQSLSITLDLWHSVNLRLSSVFCPRRNFLFSFVLKAWHAQTAQRSGLRPLAWLLGNGMTSVFRVLWLDGSCWSWSSTSFHPSRVQRSLFIMDQNLCSWTRLCCSKALAKVWPCPFVTSQTISMLLGGFSEARTMMSPRCKDWFSLMGCVSFKNCSMGRICQIASQLWIFPTSSTSP